MERPLGPHLQSQWSLLTDVCINAFLSQSFSATYDFLMGLPQFSFLFFFFYGFKMGGVLVTCDKKFRFVDNVRKNNEK